jgi:peptidoglycan/xylan/chitin deacetylase (PgdA/CDA1 family)/glycosyltransferase involved in cell wall biosynthesis
MPGLSVIIPSYQRCASLRKCLAALEEQTLEAEHFEVIVVDDGSYDDTAEFLRDAVFPFRMLALRTENAGQGAARNLGAREASGAHLLFLDDDVIACRDLLEEHLKLQSAHNGAIGLGRIFYEPDRKDWYIEAFADYWNRHYDDMEHGDCSWTDLYSANVSVPRELFQKIGGFATDRQPGEDVELGCRLYEAGARFVYSARAAVRHRNNKPGTAIISEAEAQGAASFQLAGKYRCALIELSSGYDRIRTGSLLVYQLLAKLNIPPRVLAWPGALLRAGARLRWHKAAQNYAFWRGVQRATRGRRDRTWNDIARGVPILAYHAFTGSVERTSRFVVAEEAFIRQMQYLHDNGHHVITMAEFSALRIDGLLPPRKTVVLTFDDGYEDFARIAWPAMKKHEFRGTVFVVTNCVGRTNDWDSGGELCGRRILSWKQVADLAAAGVDIGSHTKTHPNLTKSRADKTWSELQGSAEDLQDRLGLRPVSFAYPYGDYNAETQDALTRTGYRTACTVKPGLNSPHDGLLEIRRIEIFGTDSFARFRLKVYSGYDRPKLRQVLKSL